jgi:hypothetical protein
MLALVTNALGHIWSADLRSSMSEVAAAGGCPDAAGHRREITTHEAITHLIDVGVALEAGARIAAHLAEPTSQGVKRTETVHPSRFASAHPDSDGALVRT